MDLIKNNGYATRKNAIAKLVKAGVDLQNDRWLIASTDSGRFEPVLVGVEYADYAFLGVTVTA